MVEEKETTEKDTKGEKKPKPLKEERKKTSIERKLNYLMQPLAISGNINAPRNDRLGGNGETVVMTRGHHIDSFMKSGEGNTVLNWLSPCLHMYIGKVKKRNSI
ncbi:hypothetical protein CDAR_597161 [Caerostris darwini]|uniref:Uncharacterized protein n=1 Tax=Caerostris darwini TaxID=1538125 RepID=A0AAV4U2C0_9ARAC|nr:hypothetical protein CDAR_597161 [Caerostris darwini]